MAAAGMKAAMKSRSKKEAPAKAPDPGKKLKSGEKAAWADKGKKPSKVAMVKK